MQDVVIVGAGAAGIGCGVVLRQLGVEKFAIVDREHTGASFDRWPEGMRLITPSFTSNAFGGLDLNAVVPATSPAFTLQTEHPTGREYASYLRGLKQYFDLPVRRGVHVERLEPLKGKFRLHTSKGTIYTRKVIWATGEFGYPNLTPFPGADACLHTAKISDWKPLLGKERVIIGGYESGADAAIQLSSRGVKVTLVDRGAPWESRESDPSRALSPYTLERLASASVRLVAGFHVSHVRQNEETYHLYAANGATLSTQSKPLIATGFCGGLSQIQDLLEWDENGDVVVTENDESTQVPGLFIVGPQLRHQQIIFCFIYKFRQRFAVIGRVLCQEFGLSEKPLESYREAGMFLDDLRCCKQECRC